MSKLKETLINIVEPVLEEMGYELVALQYGREGGRSVLRIYIDVEGGVNLTDCEKVSRAVGSVLDREDPITGSYYLEVSSPGIDRPLRKAGDYVRFAGRKVKIKTFKPIDGQRNFQGQLLGCQEGQVQIAVEGGRLIFIPLEQVANARLTTVTASKEA